MEPSLIRTKMDASTIITVVTTIVSVARLGGSMKLDWTPMGGSPAGVLERSVPGGIWSILYESAGDSDKAGQTPADRTDAMVVQQVRVKENVANSCQLFGEPAQLTYPMTG